MSSAAEAPPCSRPLLLERTTREWYNSASIVYELILELQESNSTVPIMGQKDQYYWIYVGSVPTICVIGILANLSVIIVMCKRSVMLPRLSILMTGLAVYDFLLLLFGLLSFPSNATCLLIQMWTAEKLHACHVVKNLEVGIYPMLMVAYMGSVWTCVVIAVDRYIVICHPLFVKGHWTTSRVKKILVVSAFFFVIYSSPYAFHDMTEMQDSYWYKTVYSSYIYSVFFIILPVGAMVVLNILCIRGMSSSRNTEMHMQDEEKKSLSDARRRVTVISICVATTFILFNSPAFITRFIAAAVEHCTLHLGQTGKARLDTAQMFANILVILNSAANFVIYYTLSPRFRRTFAATFLCCLAGLRSRRGTNGDIHSKPSLLGNSLLTEM